MESAGEEGTAVAIRSSKALCLFSSDASCFHAEEIDARLLLQNKCRIYNCGVT